MKSIKNVEDFRQIVEQDKPILLDFYADWCGPCKAMLPTVEKLAEEYKDDFVIAKVNVDQNQELAAHFQVRSIPALFFIQGKELKEKLVGAQSRTTLENKIQQYSAVKK